MLTKTKLSEVRKALSGKQITQHQSAVIRGGDDLKLFPWIDQPGG